MPRRPNDRRPRHSGGGRALGGSAANSARRGEFVTDPMTGAMAEFRRIQPYQATKTYICPGCNQEIRAGTGHVVIVPLSDATARRHWHAPCWEHRANRRPTGR